MGIRRKIGSVVAAGAVAIAISACGPPVQSSAACSAPPDAVTSTIYNRVNADRGGLGGLAWNGQLACLALDWSTQLGNSGTFHHRDLNAQLNAPGYGGWHTLGENILSGPRSMTGDAIENAFDASPEHYANIMSGAFNSIGVGVFYAPNGNVYVTQNFGG